MSKIKVNTDTGKLRQVLFQAGYELSKKWEISSKTLTSYRCLEIYGRCLVPESIEPLLKKTFGDRFLECKNVFGSRNISFTVYLKHH